MMLYQTVSRMRPFHVTRCLEDPLFFCAESKDRGTRSLVERVRLELDPQTTQRLERVAQHEVLGLGVHSRPLPRLRNPGPSDLDASIGQIDVPESRRSDDALRRAVDRHEGQRDAALLC